MLRLKGAMARETPAKSNNNTDSEKEEKGEILTKKGDDPDGCQVSGMSLPTGAGSE